MLVSEVRPLTTVSGFGPPKPDTVGSKWLYGVFKIAFLRYKKPFLPPSDLERYPLIPSTYCHFLGTLKNKENMENGGVRHQELDIYRREVGARKLSGIHEDIP